MQTQTRPSKQPLPSPLFLPVRGRATRQPRVPCRRRHHFTSVPSLAYAWLLWLRLVILYKCLSSAIASLPGQGSGVLAALLLLPTSPAMTNQHTYVHSTYL